MSLLTQLLVLIIAARLLGSLFKRFHQPAIVGEMLAGVILGPSVLNFIQADAALSGISDLAVFLVVLSAGLEMQFKDILDALKGRGLILAILAFFIPMAAGIAVGIAYELDTMRVVFLGLCVSITALPVAVRILQSFNMLDSEIARYSVATAVLNDITALLVLGVILNLPGYLSFESIGISVLNTGWKLLALVALILGFNWGLQKLIARGVNLHRWSEKLVEVVGTEALFGILIVFVLSFGSASEALGFHFVIGAFFGALLIDQKFFLASRYNELDHTLRAITDGFLGPVFFATLGLEFKATSVKSADFVAVVLAISIASKMISGWVGGRIIGLDNVKSFGVGIILNGRGVMELVIASIAYKRGFITQGLFSALIIMGVATTIMTPLMFRRWVLPRLPKKDQSLQG
ncbi:MAG: cation:proton antiporter [Turneriella sp.]|nr:cation:proton antiporter [Turneriella sp.]